MSTKKLCEAATRGDKNEVERLLDEEGVDANSKDSVSVCVLCLLIFVLFGIEWKNCPFLLLWLWPLGRGAYAARSRSEPAGQG